MKCPNCGAELREGAQFCSKCGTALEEPVKERRVKPLYIVIGAVVLAIMVIGLGTYLFIRRNDTSPKQAEMHVEENDASIMMDSYEQTEADLDVQPQTELFVESVTWNNDKDGFDPLGDSTVISFTLSDGTIKSFDMGLTSMVEGMEELDIDNDGIKEYVVNAYFVDTAGENDLLYIFKQYDGSRIEQIYPTDSTPLNENATRTTITVDGKEHYALNITRYEKEDGISYVSLEKTIYFSGNEWKDYYRESDREWAKAYTVFLQDYNLGNTLEYYDENGIFHSEEPWLQYMKNERQDDIKAEFTLSDLDSDGCPELFLECVTGYSQSIFTYVDGKIIALDQYAGYETSGTAECYNIQFSQYFIISHSSTMGNETSLYELSNGKTEKILECSGNTSNDVAFNGRDEKEITKEEFAQEFYYYTGEEWICEYPGDENFDAMMHGYHIENVNSGKYYDTTDGERIISEWRGN